MIGKSIMIMIKFNKYLLNGKREFVKCCKLLRGNIFSY